MLLCAGIAGGSPSSREQRMLPGVLILPLCVFSGCSYIYTCDALCGCLHTSSVGGPVQPEAGADRPKVERLYLLFLLSVALVYVNLQEGTRSFSAAALQLYTN